MGQEKRLSYPIHLQVKECLGWVPRKAGKDPPLELLESVAYPGGSGVAGGKRDLCRLDLGGESLQFRSGMGSAVR